MLDDDGRVGGASSSPELAEVLVGALVGAADGGRGRRAFRVALADGAECGQFALGAGRTPLAPDLHACEQKQGLRQSCRRQKRRSMHRSRKEN